MLWTQSRDGLKSRNFERRGVIMVVGEPLFFDFFDTADRGVIDTIWQKSNLLAKAGSFAK